MKKYKNPDIDKPDRRESPQDFMRNFMAFLKSNEDYKNITPKAFAIIRRERWEKEKKEMKS